MAPVLTLLVAVELGCAGALASGVLLGADCPHAETSRQARTRVGAELFIAISDSNASASAV
jgi:hypothetical protein